MKKAICFVLTMTMILLIIGCASNRALNSRKIDKLFGLKADKKEKLAEHIQEEEVSLDDLFEEENIFEVSKKDALALLSQPEEEIAIFPKSTWFYFELGSSQLSKKDIVRAQDIGDLLEQNPEYEIKGIYADADQRGWLKEGYSSDIDSIIVVSFDSTDAEVAVKIPIFGSLQGLTSKLSEAEDKSLALDGGKMVVCAQSVARAIGLRLFNFGYLTGHNKRAVLVVIGKKSTELADFKSEIKEELGKVNNQLDVHKLRLGLLEKQKHYDWSFLAGGHAVTFGESRDLITPMAGLRFSYKDYFVQILGGLNPWSSGPGYKGCWYRDVLGTGSIGYDFYKSNQWTVNAQAGALIGWEYTSETNEFALQILGIMGGLGIEREIKKDISVGFSLNVVYAETSDVTIETGKMRNGFYVSAFIKLF